MGWGLAAAWLAVAGLVILTFGTGVQAWANLAEFKSLRQKVTKEAWHACKTSVALSFLVPGLTASS